MNVFRFAILTAVSRPEQAAADKFSLADQETAARARGEDKGWRETAGPFVVPGESRTRWVNLRDAEMAIPPLREMLEAAARREFDLLVIYDYNRLRDLLTLISKALAAYGVQIYSVSQPVEPQTPDDYDPYASDSAVIMEGMAGITTRLQIADLRRKYRTHMPERVTKHGVPAIGIPYGYRKPKGSESNSKAVPEQDPLTAAYVVKMKDMLLDGQSIRQMIAYLQQEHVPPPHGPRWWPNTVRNILRNPFYAGKVRWGLSHSRVDPRTGQRARAWPPRQDRLLTGQGKHVPLWDEETHCAIVAELTRRGHGFRGPKNNQFTGLMRCGVCGASMWHHNNGRKGAKQIWRCSTYLAGHPTLTHVDALEKIGLALVEAVKGETLTASEPEPETSNPRTDLDLIEALTQKRKRIEAGYENGLYSVEAFAEKVAALDEQLKTLHRETEAAHTQQEYRARWLETLGGLAGMVEYLPVWLAEEQRGKVNKVLSALLQEIVWDGEQIVLRWRQSP